MDKSICQALKSRPRERNTILAIGEARSRFDYTNTSHSHSVTKSTDPQGNTLAYIYDAPGNRDTTESSQYPGLNRQIRKTLPDNYQLRYGYDHNGNLTSYLDAGGEVTYGYDQANRLGTLLEPGAGTPVRFDYDNDNRRTKTTYPTTPATVIDVGYDDSGRQTSVKATAGTTTLSSFTYSYSKLGADTALRQSVTDPAGTTSYTYDGLNRLTGASGALSRTYEYDIDFNRTKKTESGTATTYGYNAANQLTTVNGTATYSYDGNGNLG